MSPVIKNFVILTGPLAPLVFNNKLPLIAVSSEVVTDSFRSLNGLVGVQSHGSTVGFAGVTTIARLDVAVPPLPSLRL